MLAATDSAWHLHLCKCMFELSWLADKSHTVCDLCKTWAVEFLCHLHTIWCTTVTPHHTVLVLVPCAELWRLKDVHIVHYNVTNKPWSADDDPHPLWQYWRHMFNHVPALHATVQPTKPVGTTAAAAAAAAASRGMPSATALPGMQPATVPPMRAVA